MITATQPTTKSKIERGRILMRGGMDRRVCYARRREYYQNKNAYSEM